MNRSDETVAQRVAAYCRVSTDREDQAASFESQQRYFRQYIRQQPGWKLCEIFADEGLSGTSTQKRVAFLRMIEAARRGEIDLIITKEISRFARNTLDSIYYTRELRRCGVGVLFLNDGLDTREADAELRLTILASLAQEESRRTSQRVKWGQKRRMEQGIVFGRSLLGYDVKNGVMSINEEGGAVVRRIFYQFTTEGKGTHRIARELTEDGILPPRGTVWQSSVVLRILRNEKYCGDLIQKKTFTPDYLTHKKQYNRGQEEKVVLRDHHPALISRAVFDRANRLLDERSRAMTEIPKGGQRHVLSGKICCGLCGHHYVARYKRRKDGSFRQTWRCLTAVQHGRRHHDDRGLWWGCDAVTLPEEAVLTAFLAALEQTFPEKEKVWARFCRRCREERRAEEEKSVDSKAKERLSRLLTQGLLTKEEYEAASRTLSAAELPAMPPNEPNEGTVPEQLDPAFLWRQEAFLSAAVDWLLDRVVVTGQQPLQVFLKEGAAPVCLSFPR